MDSFEQLAQYAVEIRHHIHQNPELSMKEYQTTALIKRELASFGAEITSWDDMTGAVGLIRGKSDGPTIAFRADIDALPIQEQTDCSYASRTPGVMHACAHDGHTAILLCIGKYFSQHRDELEGNVKLIFQPGEEVPPGGARQMIEKGVLENPRVDALFGLHHATENRTGTIGFRSGPFLASADSFTLKIKVKGGGGSAPHKGVDGIMVTAQILTAIEVELTRRIDPVKYGLISFGTIQGGTAFNILAPEVTVTGTARAFYQETADKLPDLIRDVAGGIAALYGGEIELDYRKAYPVVINDNEMTMLLKKAAGSVLGSENVIEASPIMAGDDMAYFLQKVPGSYFWWGITPESGMIAPAHTAHFNIDESAFLPVIQVCIRVIQEAIQYFKLRS